MVGRSPLIARSVKWNNDLGIANELSARWYVRLS